MAASPIESFIRSRRDASRDEAFEEFLSTPRIRDWTAGDDGRVERLRTEFHRAWERVNGATAGEDPFEEPEDAPSGTHRVHVEDTAARPRAASPAKPQPAAPGTGEVPAAAEAKWARFGKVTQSVMCPKCGSTRLNAHLDRDVVNIRCRQCDTVYGDLLELIPVRRVGPFAFLFGEGLGGVATAVGMGAALALVYGVLKWVV